MPVLPLVGSTMTDLPRSDDAALLGVVDHAPADAVLDRAAGIARLELDGDRAGQTLAETVEEDDRCVADGGVNRGCDVRHDCLHTIERGSLSAMLVAYSALG